MTRHSDLVSACQKWLLAQGHYVWRNPTVGIWDKERGVYRRAAHRGPGDLIGCIPPSGRHIEVEVKVGRDKQSPKQLEHARRITEAGGLSLVVHDTVDALYQAIIDNALSKM